MEFREEPEKSDAVIAIFLDVWEGERWIGYINGQF